MGVDLVLAQQESHALDVAVDRLVLETEHGGQIERGCADLDAHAGEGMPGLVEPLRRMQQGLGGNAPDVEAGAAEGLFLLDHGHFHAELGRPDGAHIASGAGADDDEIVTGHDRVRFNFLPMIDEVQG